jgi:hypothetical protein
MATPGEAAAGIAATRSTFCAFKEVDPSAAYVRNNNPRLQTLEVNATEEDLVFNEGLRLL